MTEEILSGFVRQRRNLIGITIILFLIESLDLKFTQINILGNRAEIGNPGLVMCWLWVAFGYFSWRYTTYFLDVNRGFHQRYKSYMEAYGYKFAAQLTETEKKIADDLKKPYLSGKQVTKDNLQVECFDISLIEFSGQGMKFSKKIRVRHNQGSDHWVGPHSEPIQVLIPNEKLVLQKIISFFKTVIFSNKFNEYYLPFVLALFLILYQAYSIIISTV